MVNRTTIELLRCGHSSVISDLYDIHNNYDEKKRTYMGLKSIIAGGISGATQLLVTYPIEYVKTQIQLDEKGANSLYTGSWDVTQKTFKKSGFLGFYNGVGITLCGYIQKVAIRFYVLEIMRNSLADSKGQISTNMKMLCGLVAGAAEAVTSVTPFETIKVKFINDERRATRQYLGLIHGIKTIIKTEGIHGIYQGSTATILKEATNQAVRYSLVETLKEIYTGKDPKISVPVGWTAFFGAVGGALSVGVNNPIDVVKTRMQGLDAKRYKNTWDCFVKIFNHEGFRAFYKGALPRMTRVSIDVAITFAVYDKIMEWLDKVF